jgi:hypothetical protein
MERFIVQIQCTYNDKMIVSPGVATGSVDTRRRVRDRGETAGDREGTVVRGVPPVQRSL